MDPLPTDMDWKATDDMPMIKQEIPDPDLPMDSVPKAEQEMLPPPMVPWHQTFRSDSVASSDISHPSPSAHARSKESAWSAYSSRESTYFSTRSTYRSPSVASSYVSARSSYSVGGGEVASPRRPAPYPSTSEYRKVLAEKGLLLSEKDELNWAGRAAGMGQHTEFQPFEMVPLEVLGLIGSSATARVHKVLCRRITLARKSMTCNRKFTVRDALNEVEHLQKLRHRHIIQLVGSYVHGRTFAILLYPVATYDLTDFMDRVTQILALEHMKVRDYVAVLSLARFFRCLSSALAHIHDNTIKHMDIKPSNILVKEHPRYDLVYEVYIADFGISRSFQPLDHSQTESVTARSPKYCAPEVYTHSKRGRSADVFSMGCVFLEMYTVLCRKTLDSFADHRSGDSGDESFHANLSKVLSWAESLRSTVPYFLIDGSRSQASLDDLVAVPTAVIRRAGIIPGMIYGMLQSCPTGRPGAWEILGTFPENHCCHKKPEPFEAENSERPVGFTGISNRDFSHVGNVFGRSHSTYMVEQAVSDGRLDIFDEMPCLPSKSTAELLLLSRIVAFGYGLLHLASLNGHEGIVTQLLASGVNVDKTDSDKRTALHLAAYYGHEKVLKLLLGEGAITSITDKYGMTALQLAAFQGNEQVVRLLLDGGGHIQAEGLIGRTALAIASSQGFLPVAELLLDRGANLELESSRGRTPLHEASFRGFEQVVGLLLDRGANVEAKTSLGETALHIAFFKGSERVVRLLLDRGADVEAEANLGRAALHMASSTGSKKVVRLLLDRGADMEARTSLGETALHIASFKGSERVVRLLLDRGADVEAKANLGRAALHMASSTGSEQVVRLLLDRGADVEARTSGGDTALYAACSKGFEQVVRLLLDRGAKLDAKIPLDATALSVAFRRGFLPIIELLLDRGADLKSLDRASLPADGQLVLLLMEKGASAVERELCDAIRRGCMSEGVLRLLLDRGVQINLRDWAGRTLLHHATWKGSEDAVRLLLDRGIDIEVKDQWEQTPLHKACSNGHYKVVALLLAKGANMKARDRNGETPLHMACSKGPFEVGKAREITVSLLLEAGASVVAKNVKGRTPLVYRFGSSLRIGSLLDNASRLEHNSRLD